MNPEMSPQILAVLKVLENRMGGPPTALGGPPASFNERFSGTPATFDDRFRTFEGEQATVMPHEIEYGMSRKPYEHKIVDDLFANAAMPKAGDPDFGGMNDPNLMDFLSPGM